MSARNPRAELDAFYRFARDNAKEFARIEEFPRCGYTVATYDQERLFKAFAASMIINKEVAA